MIYPNGLLMAKIVKDTKDRSANKLAYTKHYYIGAERISAKIGTSTNLGLYPVELVNSTMPEIDQIAVRNPSNQSVQDAGAIVAGVYAKFNQPAPANNPIIEGNFWTIAHENINKTNYFYFHPDHLGSSSYITNKDGIVSQHMEYLPFGETLVDEHLNSYNSPFKYNGKEFDAETGNYYYGARNYDPKWSIFISVDPLAEQAPDWSPYRYGFNNPIKYTDPTGMFEDWYKDNNGEMQFDPKVKDQASLGDRGTYVGATHSETTKRGGTADYRKDGSILFSNEKDGYDRIWRNSFANQREQFGIIGKESVLVTPDFNNTLTNSTLSDYGYSFNSGNLQDPVTGKEFKTIATVYSHPVSFNDTKGWPSLTDVNFACNSTPNKPAFVLVNERNKTNSVMFAIGNSSKYAIKYAHELDPKINGNSIRSSQSLRQFAQGIKF